MKFWFEKKDGRVHFDLGRPDMPNFYLHCRFYIMHALAFLVLLLLLALLYWFGLFQIATVILVIIIAAELSKKK